MIYNELKQHGKDDFPFELYRLDHDHPKYEMAFHWHTNLEFVRVLDGTFHLTLDNRSYDLQRGDVALINTETVHGGSPENCIYECIVFNPAFLKTGNRDCDELIENLITHQAFLPEMPQDDLIRNAAYAVFDAIKSNGPGMYFRVIAACHVLFAVILENGCAAVSLPTASISDEKKTVKLKTILKFIRENFSENITLEDMAAVSGYSCKYFCSFFKEMTGTTPVHYLTNYRIERAARKLLGTDDSITKIAFDCGFNDLSYFIKTFKKLKNCSPKAYRKGLIHSAQNKNTRIQ